MPLCVALGLMIVVYTAVSAPGLSGHALLTHRIAATCTGGGIMDLIGLLFVLVFIIPSERRERIKA